MSTQNRRNSGIKTTPETQALPSDRERRLQNRNVRRNDPTPQFRPLKLRTRAQTSL